jgi:hypothetical protein
MRGFFAAIAPHIAALHGYTHGGLEQLGRRFDAVGNVRPTYADGAKQTCLAHAILQAVAQDVPRYLQLQHPRAASRL